MNALRRYRVGLALMVLAIIVGILVFYRLKDQQARAVQRPRGDTLVGVVTPVRKDLEIRFGTTADILANQQAAIFSKVSGYIRRIHVDRGDFVKEGQLLVEIDDQELQAQLQQARAGLLTGQASHQMARSTLEGNRANLENQRANLLKARAVADNDARQSDRMKALFERGLVSATDWENARTTAEASRAQVQATEAQLRVAESQILASESQVRLAEAQIETYRAALELAQTNLANTRLVAPFTGYVSQRNLDTGAAVSAGSSGTNTSSLGILVVQDIKSVKVQVEVPERQIARVVPGVPVRLSVDPYTGQVFSGTVTRIVHALDPRSRTMGVEVDIPNPEGRLKPGMFARVDLLVDRRPGALAVPIEALRVGDGKPSVVVVRSGTVEFVTVELGVTDGGWVEITKGVGDKDSVVVQGKDLVKAGQKVKAVPATGA